MQINKEIIKRIKHFTINGDATQVEIAAFCGLKQPQISRTLKYGEGSRELNDKLIEFIVKKDKEIAARKKREAKILNRNKSAA